ncbi:MAG: multi-sensor signal transduction histidine kinase [Solirubrobacterales bacterium]|nr:multi-sensor signal transduction histidine kinase [Solirubrobacterales bacterium]
MTRSGPLHVGQRFALVIAVLGLLLVVGVYAGARASMSLADARERLVLRIDPALLSALDLQNAYLNQETGVRGFVLAGDARFRAPFDRGRVAERRAAARLRGLMAQDPSLATAKRNLADVTVLGRRWQEGFAIPAIDARRTKSRDDDVNVGAGRVRFDRVRRGLAVLQQELAGARRHARMQLDTDARSLNRVLALVAVLLAAGGLAAALFIRRAITLPLADLADEVRRVADGDYQRAIEARGPQDVVALGQDVDTMRARILQELTAVQAVQQDLERSNAELEQFAYVASHDLQEPLRKVASFTQMLQRRYEGQLDEKADQYIFFAVDGAKRMQELINDLLAFSRVGRVTRERRAVPLQDIIDRALTDLSGAIEASGAEVQVHGTPPTVVVDPGLMALVFQNLVGNAVKFSGDGAAPRVRIDVTESAGVCEVAIHDDGIGIDDEYADRIFVIFQRLHPKERYGGTGIGLAMCRKIVEYHGGRIWLDTEDDEPGTTFRFTLAIPDADADADPDTEPGHAADARTPDNHEVPIT